MTEGIYPLQVAIYTALSGHLTNGVPVYDDVPTSPDPVYPHVELGAARSYDWSAANVRGEDRVIEIHVWSRYKGTKEASRIMGEIKLLLHEVDLTLTGADLVFLRYEGADDPFKDADGITRHGIVRFRAITTT